jgi:prepilin-type N-terminal cleavage/methylation domain-containing protein
VTGRTTRAPGARRTLGDRRGFTLVELVIAVIILCVGVLALAGTMQASARLQRIGRSRDELTTLAESKLESMRAAATYRTADTLQLAVGGSLTASATAHADTVQALNGRAYVRRWLVAAGPAGARQVTMRVAPHAKTSYDLRWLDFTTLVLIL